MTSKKSSAMGFITIIIPVDQTWTKIVIRLVHFDLYIKEEYQCCFKFALISQVEVKFKLKKKVLGILNVVLTL